MQINFALIESINKDEENLQFNEKIDKKENVNIQSIKEFNSSQIFEINQDMPIETETNSTIFFRIDDLASDPDEICNQYNICYCPLIWSMESRVLTQATLYYFFLM